MDNIKFYAKTATAGLVRWLLVFFGGIVTTLIISPTIALNAPENFRGAPLVIFIVFFTLIFVAIYFIVANKISISFILGRLFDEKLSSFIGEKFYNLLYTFSEKQPNWLQSIKNGASLKDKLLDSTKQDSSLNTIQHKVITYGLKKINLDDINFQQENLNLSQEVTNKLMQKLSELAKHSYQLFWIVVGVQVIGLIASFAYKLQ